MGVFFIMANNQSSNNGAFRKKKIKFTQVSNLALRDPNLSLRARGLYGTIQSYITLEDFIIYKNYLVSICSDGKSSFDRAWDELKAAGYLVQYQMKDDEGKIYYEYDLLDEPRQLSEEEILAAEIKEANRVARNKRKVEKQKAKKQPVTEVPPMEEIAKTTDGSSTNGSSTNGSSVYIINTDLNNTDLNNTISSSSDEDEEVITLYKDYRGIKRLSAAEKKLLLELIQKHNKDVVVNAISVAVSKCSKPNFAYVESVCINGIIVGDKSNNPAQVKSVGKNTRFTNISSHNWDMDQLEALEQEYIQKKLHGAL